MTPNDLDDSGVVDGSASEATPSSVADLVDENKPEEKPTMLEIPKDIQPIKVEELENYIMERRDNDNEGLWKEYAVSMMGVRSGIGIIGWCWWLNTNCGNSSALVTAVLL